MVTVEDLDEEDPEDSITEGEGAKEVNEADEAFDSEPIEKTMKKSSSLKKKSLDSARADEDDEGKDMEGGVSAEDEDDSEATVAAMKEAVEKQLNTLYEEPTKKQKVWVERVKAIHEVEGATSFTESEETCGSTGGLAVFTIWGHVPNVVRDAITTFIGESESKSKSPFSLLSLRAKALQLVKAYDAPNIESSSLTAFLPITIEKSPTFNPNFALMACAIEATNRCGCFALQLSANSAPWKKRC